MHLVFALVLSQFSFLMNRFLIKLLIDYDYQNE